MPVSICLEDGMAYVQQQTIINTHDISSQCNWGKDISPIGFTENWLNIYNASVPRSTHGRSFESKL